MHNFKCACNSCCAITRIRKSKMVNFFWYDVFSQAISAVDLALWDLLGKLKKQPVYALLGGKTKVWCHAYKTMALFINIHCCIEILQERLPVYSTTARPDIAKVLHCNKLLQSACTIIMHTKTQSLEFVGAKIPCAYGPSEGDIGLAKNVELFCKARESVGPDFPLMWVLMKLRNSCRCTVYTDNSKLLLTMRGHCMVGCDFRSFFTFFLTHTHDQGWIATCLWVFPTP